MIIFFFIFLWNLFCEIKFARQQHRATDDVAVEGVAVGGGEEGVGVVTSVEEVVEGETPDHALQFQLGGGGEKGGVLVLVARELAAHEVVVGTEFEAVDGIDGDGGMGAEVIVTVVLALVAGKVLGIVAAESQFRP